MKSSGDFNMESENFPIKTGAWIKSKDKWIYTARPEKVKAEIIFYAYPPHMEPPTGEMKCTVVDK